MAKKLRRKDLKKPDEFINRGMAFGQWIREHQRVVTFAAVGVVVAVLAVALTIHLTQSSREGASASLWEAMDIQGAPVTGTKNDDEEGEDREPPRGYETFDTAEDRAKAASKAFQAVVDSHDGSPASRAASLGLASSLFTEGEYSKARTLYEGFLADTGGLDHLKVIAVEGVGYCHEAGENYERALESYRDLEKMGDGLHRDLAQYHQGRMLEKMNKANDAADMYRAVVRRAEQATEDTETNLFVRDRAEARLAVVDPGSDLLKGRSKRQSQDLLRQLMSGQGGRGLPGGGPPRGGPPRGAPPAGGGR